MTFGTNTFFTLRSNNSFCYIGQVDDWLKEEEDAVDGLGLRRPKCHFRRPRASQAHTTRPSSCGSSTIGTRDSVKSSQTNMGWDSDTRFGTGSWYGIYFINLCI